MEKQLLSNINSTLLNENHFRSIVVCLFANNFSSVLSSLFIYTIGVRSTDILHIGLRLIVV